MPEIVDTDEIRDRLKDALDFDIELNEKRPGFFEKINLKIRNLLGIEASASAGTVIGVGFTSCLLAFFV